MRGRIRRGKSGAKPRQYGCCQVPIGILTSFALAIEGFMAARHAGADGFGNPYGSGTIARLRNRAPGCRVAADGEKQIRVVFDKLWP